MRENREAQKRMKDNDNDPLSMEAMLDSLRDEVANDPPRESEEDSDVAPMSALVDTPSKEELKRREIKKA